MKLIYGKKDLVAVDVVAVDHVAVVVADRKFYVYYLTFFKITLWLFLLLLYDLSDAAVVAVNLAAAAVNAAVVDVVVAGKHL